MTIELRPFPRAALERLGAEPELIEALRLLWLSQEETAQTANSLAARAETGLLSRVAGLSARLDDVEEVVGEDGSISASGAATIGGNLTVSGVASVSGGLTSGGAVLGSELTASDETPEIFLHETDGGADEKYWRSLASGGAYALQTFDDARASGENVHLVNRSGTAVSRQRFYVGGSSILDLTSLGLGVSGFIDADEITMGDARILQASATILDGGVATIDWGFDVSYGALIVSSSSFSTTGAVYWIRCSTSASGAILIGAASGFWKGATGTTLTGSTGAAGDVTVSADNTSGELQIENQRGFTLGIQLLAIVEET